MDKLTAIQVFLIVAETGSFTAASEQLEMSKPMVSRYIALMEEWLNARLLQRTTRKVALTDVGEQAVVFCQKILNQSLEMEQEIAAERGELSGLVRLTCNSSFGASHLLSAVNDFLAEHPKLNIQLQLSDNTFDLISERIDLAVRITNQPDLNAVARKLADCHSLLVATPEYLAKFGTPQTPNELYQHHFLSHANVSRKILPLQQGNHRLELTLNSRFSTNDTNALLNSALAHNGITMLPKYMINELISQGKLTAVLTDWQLPAYGVYLMYPTRHRLPLAVRKLVDFLMERFEKMDW